MTPTWAIIVDLISAFMAGLSPIFLKRASKTITLSPKTLFNKNFFTGACLHGGGLLLYIPTLKVGEISFLYPLAATSYFWATIFSKKILHEKITTYKIIGLTFIFVGIVAIAMTS